MKPQNDKSVSSKQRAIKELREMIFSGDLPAGSDHLESELAEQLGLSRTPVREAALILEAQGLLELRPRKGVRIGSVSPDDMREIYDVLTELEALAARRAAERGLKDVELKRLAQSIDDMEDALAKNALKTWAEADDRFHSELVVLGGNSRVRTIVDMMSDQVRRARSVTLFMRPLPVASNEDHRRVYEAIRTGAAEVAAQIHREHRRNSKEMIVALLEKHRLNRV